MILTPAVLGFTRRALIVLIAVFLSGCLTPRKVDRFVAKQYGSQLPPESRKKNAEITVTSALSTNAEFISNTESKTSHVLPLIVYWQFDYKNTCALNPDIPIRYFTNTVLSEAQSKLNPLLNGDQLVISIEQLPDAFAIDDKAHIIWLIYGYEWDKVTIQPQTNDLVVSYQVLQNNNVVKSGKITVADKETDQRLRFFQSWKNATSSYILQYNHDIVSMAGSFVDQLAKEL